MFQLTGKAVQSHPIEVQGQRSYSTPPMVPVLDLDLPKIITHTCQTPLESSVGESLKHWPQASREYIPYG